MFHRAEEDVDEEADDNRQVEKGVGDDGVEPALEPAPTAATVPRQEALGTGGAARTGRR